MLAGSPSLLLLCVHLSWTVAEGQTECIYTCFSVTLLSGAGVCRELGHATNRSQPVSFGQWEGERVPEGQGKWEKCNIGQLLPCL
jgi:hypothetical protein